MGMTEEQGQQVIDRLRQRVPGGWLPCPVCKSNLWQIGSDLLVAGATDNFTVGLSATPRLYVFANVGCGVCGYSMLFDLEKLGLLDLIRELGGKIDG